jgi:hypothetical protein
MRRWTLILIAAMCTACATNCPSHRPCYGRPLELEPIRTIEAGVTTAADLSRKLGEPADLAIAEDGSETWVWRYRSTLHRFDDPSEPCSKLGRIPLLGGLFRLAAAVRLSACVESQTEAELRVELDPRLVVRARELAIWEVPDRGLPVLIHDDRDGS